MFVSERNTVPGAMQGETSTAGTLARRSVRTQIPDHPASSHDRAPRRRPAAAMIVAPAVLIVRDKEQRPVPCGRGAHGAPDGVQERLAGVDVVRRMLIVRIDEKARFDEP